ncbi:hypothetical protein BHM03_00052771 [Ensete ventricosum]|nr:hypothetical protein BHM03_00052771 [Ensete ventricosum]
MRQLACGAAACATSTARGCLHVRPSPLDAAAWVVGSVVDAADLYAHSGLVEIVVATGFAAYERQNAAEGWSPEDSAKSARKGVVGRRADPMIVSIGEAIAAAVGAIGNGGCGRGKKKQRRTMLLLQHPLPQQGVAVWDDDTVAKQR